MGNDRFGKSAAEKALEACAVSFMGVARSAAYLGLKQGEWSFNGNDGTEYIIHLDGDEVHIAPKASLSDFEADFYR